MRAIHLHCILAWTVLFALSPALPAVSRASGGYGIIETSEGTIRIRLLPDKAPAHVRKWKELAQQGFFDGTTFHRVIAGFLVQAGDGATRDQDPTNDGRVAPGFLLNQEFNDMKHRRGVVSAARRVDVERLSRNLPEREMFLNSANSQFFILLADSPKLDGRFTVFGVVEEGMDVVERISLMPRDAWDRPLSRIEILKAFVSQDTQAAAERFVRVSRTRVNIRSGPGVDHFSISRLPEGTRLVFNGVVEADWYEVVLPDGRTGWVRSDMVESVD